MKRINITLVTLFIVLFLRLPFTLAAQCLPDLGNGNICTAKDFVLSELAISGPTSCTEGEIISQPITVRFGIQPTANERYDIGLFVGDHGESPIQGDSCTFSSLTPIENGGVFDGLSGSGPYRDLDSNQCGDTLKNDDIIYRDVVLNDVLCKDSNNDGKLDVAYALTWQQQQRSCTDPLDPVNFFPPTSSKCLTAVGNFDDIEVLPPTVFPSITVSKSVSPQIVEAPGGNVSYTLTIENNGTEAVTLTTLNDNKFGPINGMGSCSLPKNLEPNESYNCSFSAEVSGIAGTTHTNTVTATAEDSDGNTATDTDNATVLFFAPSEPTGSIGDLVWNDLNGDGFHTADEPGIGDVDVILFQDTGSGYTTVKTVQTTADGHYEFVELPAGTYRVTPDTSKAPLNHWVHTGGIMPHDVVLSDDEHYQIADFGFSQAAITLIKTVDQNVVAAPTASVNYTITVTNSGAVEVILIQLVDTRFGDLSSQTCSLPQNISPGGNFSCQFTKTITGSPGDVHKNTATALAWDQDQNPVYAADSARILFIDGTDAAIGHLVWNDVNANGSYDSGEPLFDYVTLALSGPAVGTTTTQNNGFYSFSELRSGNYDVNVTDTNNILSLYVLTTSNQPYTKNLSAGEIDYVANFGYAKAEINITKTADKTTIYTPNEDVVFSLTVSNTGSIDLNVTNLVDSKFGNLNTTCDPNLPRTLTAGNTFTCTFTRNITGNAGDTHSNVATVTAQDSANNTFVASDNENIDIIAASGGAIGYLVWHDIDGDGTKDDDEPGIDDVSLDLIQNGSVAKTTITANNGHYAFKVENGTYEIKVTDTNHLLDNAILSSGTNPHTGISIDSSIYSAANFGYTLPATRPVISVTKIGSTSTIETSELVTFNITVQNNGAVDVTLASLIDSVFGSLDGKGSCNTGGTISTGNSYACSFSETLTGSIGDTHNNIVFAVAKDGRQQIALGADNWQIDFIQHPIPTLSEWGMIILSLLLAVSAYFVIRKRQSALS